MSVLYTEVCVGTTPGAKRLRETSKVPPFARVGPLPREQRIRLPDSASPSHPLADSAGISARYIVWLASPRGLPCGSGVAQ